VVAVEAAFVGLETLGLAGSGVSLEPQPTSTRHAAVATSADRLLEVLKNF